MSQVTIFLKHDDRAFIKMDDIEHEGYLPYVNETIGGDDTRLVIDNETGLIQNWKAVRIEDGKFVNIYGD